MSIQSTKTILGQIVQLHWSPEPPAAYGKNPAAWAQKHPGAFNLGWAVSPHPASLGHYAAHFVPVEGVLVNGYPLREWLCVYKPQQFLPFFLDSDATRELRKMVRPAAMAALERSKEPA